MKRKWHKIFALTIAFHFLWMGMSPAYALFGDTCCTHHTLAPSQQKDRSSHVPIKNHHCGCGRPKSSPACSERSVLNGPYIGHAVIKRADSLARMLSDLFHDLVPKVKISWAGHPCCDIEKAPVSPVHEASVLFPSQRFEKPFFAGLSHISEWPGGLGQFGIKHPLSVWGVTRASFTPIYLENKAFLI